LSIVSLTNPTLRSIGLTFGVDAGATIPEPSTLALSGLLLAGGAAAGACRRRTRV
jgi:PEP-CTERM motif